MFKFNNKTCETCPELTIKTLEQCDCHSDVFIVNFKQISHLFLVFSLLTLSKQMLAGLKLFKRKKATINQF